MKTSFNSMLPKIAAKTLLILALAAPGLFWSCDTNLEEPLPDEPTPPTPEPPVDVDDKIDTVRIRLSTIEDFEKNISAAENADPKKTYIIADAVSDFAADSADISGTMTKWHAADIAHDNVETRQNGRSTFPATGAGRVITHAGWTSGGKWPVSKAPNGLEYLAATKSDSAAFGADGIRLNVRGGAGAPRPGATDTVIHVSSRSDLAEKTAQARNVPPRQKLWFSIDADMELTAADIALFDGLPAEFTGTGRISPAENNTRAAGGVLRAMMPVLTGGGEKRFYVSGADGADALGGTEYVINSDTVSVSRWLNGETNIVPKRAYVNVDRFDARTLEYIAKNLQPRQWVALVERANDNVPGGANRIANIGNKNMAGVMTMAAAEFYAQSYGRAVDTVSMKDLGVRFAYMAEDPHSGRLFQFANIMPSSADLSDGVLNDMDCEPYSSLIHILEEFYSYHIGGWGVPVPELAGHAPDSVSIGFSVSGKYLDNHIMRDNGMKFVRLSVLENFTNMLNVMAPKKKIVFLDDMYVLYGLDGTTFGQEKTKETSAWLNARNAKISEESIVEGEYSRLFSMILNGHVKSAIR
jgi:hypothetical protein